MKIINQIKLNYNHNFDELLKKVSKIACVKTSDIDLDKFKILHRSIDARDKNNILFSYNVALDYNINEDNKIYNPIIKNNFDKKRPIVVGFGPAGIFASYILVLNGIKPIILERGKNIDERIKDVEIFFNNMKLNEESNVCFGEGGAGAFSDGKLNTNNKDRFGMYKFVLETFVKYGADKKILYENLPHIGTDKLVNVIKNMRNEILRLGGEICYNTKFTVAEYNKYANNGIPIILAIGNSSRDTFRDLYNNGFDVKAKTIAIGYRIAHAQNLINEAQYGRNDIDKKVKILGTATYKLVHNITKNVAVYSFCMCPGGYIINSSNVNGYLSINGMSYNDRNGKYANSAIVTTVNPSDIRDDENNPLKSLELQELVEKKTFDLVNGYIPYYTKESIIEEEVFKGKAKKCDNLNVIFDGLNVSNDINSNIIDGLNKFDKIINGFSKGVLAGVETRTSSPITIFRNEKFMCNIENYYPCGEGLGHGGGIMSCAVDGIMVAENVIKNG